MGLTMIRKLLSLYSWHYPAALVRLLQINDYLPGRFLRQYWQTTDFSPQARPHAPEPTPAAQKILLVIKLGILFEVAAGLVLIVLWGRNDLLGGWQFGLAAILAYPIIWAHMLALLVVLWWVVHPKALGRAIVCRILEAQVRRLRAKQTFSVVAVVGSVGKTSTKIAIARLLDVSRRVRWQEGNYNDRVTVPLVFFGHNQPHILNVFAWLKIFVANETTIRKPYPFQVVVAELGTDAPGFIKDFAYIKPELVVVTAITPEHMEFFGTLDAVAREELSALHYAKRALINTDDTDSKYLEDRNYMSYGLDGKTDYRLSERHAKDMHGQQVTFHLGQDEAFSMQIPLLGEQGAKIALAAAAAAHMLKLPLDDIKRGIANISAFAGRMQILYGIQNSTIIDDTYNSSPIAAKAALDVLYAGDAPQKIAVMGSMNELGDYSPEAHREVGEHCDPSQLDWLITIGPDAKKYLAPVAKERGCQVKSFTSPYKAGAFIKEQLKEGAVVLAKGSQNRVFAEEALKPILANPDDQAKLVRQSAYWMKIKAGQFKP